MKVYIAGKITGNPDYKRQFLDAERYLKSQGHITMNPAVLPAGFEHHEYMTICFAMINVCDAVYFLHNWTVSIGARMEFDHAKSIEKILIFQVVERLESPLPSHMYDNPVFLEVGMNAES
ncbi:MAG: DUF4406 domain-containing protein [Syntrophomonadaceae bacterium]|nr:DUF4406 domain-containing protein [Syntrophomonadaceae bacterium]